jgi:hypothetical protein
MDGRPFRVPIAFVAARTRLTWADLRFGVANDLLSADAAFEYAHVRLYPKRDPKSGVNISVLGKSVNALVILREREVEHSVAIDEKSVSRRWLWLVLAWLLENREKFDDALGIVDGIYADFAYPTEMEPFVRYMPASPADVVVQTAPTDLLIERWSDFVARCELEYATTQ